MTVEQRRTAVLHAQDTAGLSERRACRLVGLDRATQRYQPRRDPRLALRTRLGQLAAAWPRRGYKFLHVLLRREGVLVNRKLVLRLYRELGLSVRKRRPKGVATPRTPMRRAERPNERWCMDFVNDAVASGRKFRCFTLVDEFTRECPVIEVDTSLPAMRVVTVLEQVALERGYPAEIRVDNGPEFAGKVLDAWAYAHRVTLRFIEPGKPVQNAKVESFNGRLRDECLNEHWFLTLTDARREIEAWRVRYNDERPHGALGHRTPTEFTKEYQRQQRENPNPQPSELSHCVA